MTTGNGAPTPHCEPDPQLSSPGAFGSLPRPRPHPLPRTLGKLGGSPPGSPGLWPQGAALFCPSCLHPQPPALPLTVLCLPSRSQGSPRALLPCLALPAALSSHQLPVQEEMSEASKGVLQRGGAPESLC